jgi:hypothetical protein
MTKVEIVWFVRAGFWRVRCESMAARTIPSLDPSAGRKNEVAFIVRSQSI